MSLKTDHSGRKPPPGLHFKPLNLTYYSQLHGAADHWKQNYFSLSVPPSAKTHPGRPRVVKIREASKRVVPSHLMWRLIPKSRPFLSSTRLLLLPLKTPESVLPGAGGAQHIPSTCRDGLESDHSSAPIASVHHPLPRPCPQAGTPAAPARQPACSTFMFTRHRALSSPWRLPLVWSPALPASPLACVPSSRPSSGRAHSAGPALGKHPWALFLPPSWMSVFHLCVWLTPSGFSYMSLPPFPAFLSSLN